MVKRLRRRPLTAKTGVRVPMEVPVSPGLRRKIGRFFMPWTARRPALALMPPADALCNAEPFSTSKAPRCLIGGPSVCRKTPRRAREGRSPLAFQSWAAACTSTTQLIFPRKIASLQILRPESRGFKQNLEGVAVAGEILPRPPACQNIYFDKLDVRLNGGRFRAHRINRRVSAASFPPAHRARYP